MKLASLLFLISFLGMNAFSQNNALEIGDPDTRQPTKPNEAKVLIFGDSWAGLICQNDVIYNSLKDKLGRQEVFCSTETTEFGSRAEQWTSEAYTKILAETIRAAKNAKVVILSLGGNDFLKQYKVTQTSEEAQANHQEIKARILAVIDIIQRANPSLNIVISGYDYGNFEVLESGKRLSLAQIYYKQKYAAMGKPRNPVLNEAFVNFSRIYPEIVRERAKVYYSNHTGLMQKTLGIKAPGISLSGEDLKLAGQYPDYEPLAGGNPDYPAPAQALMGYLGLKDPFHLSGKAYQTLADFLVANYILKFKLLD